jgi:hypothetical protein
VAEALKSDRPVSREGNAVLPHTSVEMLLESFVG